MVRSVIAGILVVGIASAQPRVLLTDEDLDRVKKLAAEQPWAAGALQTFLTNAANWPAAHLQKYGLKEAALPPEGGQWSHWYVCPTHGAGLQFTAPDTHVCPVDRQRLSGWPYTQVIWSRRHDDLANAARDLALAWRVTGKREYAEPAAWILGQYAEKYASWPLHDKDNRNTRSGARAHAQTLDESVWIIPLAWAYDLLAGFDGLTAERRTQIEENCLREAAKTIQRYDAGMSNWQSWHNAGIAAAALAIGDDALFRDTIDGKSGFRFQMRTSVLGEGQWYEGSWGYHFYALNALMQTAEMAARNGVDLYNEEPNFRKLFELPMRFRMPDGYLPPFNDSGTLLLAGQDRYFEAAHNRYGDPQFAAVLAGRTRGWPALFWGATELPKEPAPALASEVFPETGYAILRAAESDHTVALKFGPHGGGHGHNDKLGIISFARGGVQALDPGTQPYAAPTHNTWDKVTVAHNTAVLDEATQAEATGKLLWHDFGEGYSAAAADAGPAYRNARLRRAILHTAEYALDLFHVSDTTGAKRKIDWFYHNYGELKTDLPLVDYNAFPPRNGYQHLKNNRALETDEAWQAVFDQNASLLGSAGSVYASAGAVSGRFDYTRERAASGSFSAKAAYRFDGAGYLLYTTPIAKALPEAMPDGLRISVHGDSSGHRLAFRLYDSTDERFVTSSTVIDWTGWKTFEFRNVERWTHYLGNADGKFDLPVRSVAVELTRANETVKDGAIFVDDALLLYGEETAEAATYERELRNLRVWMLPAAGTTVVAGAGLGPDLTKPVPYAAARRQAAETLFVTLLEPFGQTPAVLEFSAPAAAVYVVKSAAWEDRIEMTLDGLTSYRRTRF
jgi:hypothetical protein